MPTITPPAFTHVSPIVRAMRPVALSRWAARIIVWGDCVLPADRTAPALGERSAVLRLRSRLGPELAASCVGLTVSRAVDKYTGSHGHWRPDGGKTVYTDLRTFAGLIEEAVADEHGIVGVLAILTPAAHEDLDGLDRAGLLGFAGLCLSLQCLSTRTTEAPWGIVVSDVERAVGRGVTLASCPLTPGARVLRRLAADEELARQDFAEPERVAVPVSWPAPGATPGVVASTLVDLARGSVTADILADGAVGTSKIGDTAVTTPKISPAAVSDTVWGGSSSYVDIDGGPTVVNGTTYGAASDPAMIVMVMGSFVVTNVPDPDTGAPYGTGLAICELIADRGLGSQVDLALLEVRITSTAESLAPVTLCAVHEKPAGVVATYDLVATGFPAGWRAGQSTLSVVGLRR
jgi:hypothetical protein